MARRSPTLRELAADLGLDPATVSRGLRDSRRVAAATRARIRQRAEELGYRPDPALARLSRHRWDGRRARQALNLAYLTTGGSGRSPAGFLSGARRMAERLGYTLRPVAVGDFADHRRLERFLGDGGMEGLLFGHLDPPRLPELDWSRFAVVACGSTSFEHPFDAVVVDTHAQMSLALDALHAAGHRRLGVVHHPLVLESDHRRLSAVDAFARRRRGPRPQLLELPFQIGAAEREAAGRWHRRQGLDAVVFPSARIARGLFPTRNERPPCALASEQGDSRGFAHCSLELPTIGELAVQQLSHALHHRLLGPPARAVRHLVVPRWVSGASLHRSEISR